MNRTAVARTYADALLELAAREGAEEDWLGCLGEVAGLVREDAEFRAFLLTPRISLEEKREVLRSALGGRYPEAFVRFLLVVLEKRRASLLPAMDHEYRELLNERTGRIHAEVTLTFEPDADLRDEIESALSRVLGRTVAADFRREPRLVGGMVVRVQDRVLDGSIRRRMQLLRRELLEGATGASPAGA